MDIKHIRRQFPIISTTTESNPLIYLDNAATTQKPWAVIERITQYYSSQNANKHRGIYQLAHQATEMFEQARASVAAFIESTPEEIIFTQGTTDAINTVAFGWGGMHLKAGDQVLVTTQEHHANFVPWQEVCKSTGAEMIAIPLQPDGTINIEDLRQLLSTKVKMVALTHISNTNGTINPVSEIIASAHKVGALVLLDAAQSVSYLPLSVQDLDCDFLAFSGHKVYGPMGVGVLFGKAKHLDSMKPFRFGGGMINRVQAQESTYKEAPYKFEAGTPPVAQAVGLEAALNFVQNVGRADLKQHADELAQYAWHKLNELSNITLYGPQIPKGPIISFNLDQIHPHDVATILGTSNIAVRAGHHCTQPLMEHYQVPGTVRVSFAVYNQKWEVDKLVEELQKVSLLMQ